MGKSKELISRRYVTRIAARMESLLRLDRFPYNFRLMDESLFDVAFHRVSSCCASFNVKEKEEKRGKGGERINRDEINSPTSKGKDRNHFPYFVVIFVVNFVIVTFPRKKVAISFVVFPGSVFRNCPISRLIISVRESRGEG